MGVGAFILAVIVLATFSFVYSRVKHCNRRKLYRRKSDSIIECTTSKTTIRNSIYSPSNNEYENCDMDAIIANGSDASQEDGTRERTYATIIKIPADERYNTQKNSIPIKIVQTDGSALNDRFIVEKLQVRFLAWAHVCA